jgi:hypothetical protein
MSYTYNKSNVIDSTAINLFVSNNLDISNNVVIDGSTECNNALIVHGSTVGVTTGGTTYGIDASGETAVYGHDGAVGVLGDGYNYGMYGLSIIPFTQIGSDINGESGGDRSGFSVSLNDNGNIIAIGAPLNEIDNSGHVRIYELNGSAWIQKGQDIDGEDASDQFGYVVSLSADGNIVAVGAPYNDGSGNDAGHTRIYEWNGSIWIQKGLDLDGGVAGDQFGWTVSLSADGNDVAIGARVNDTGANNSGRVLIYGWNGSEWIQKGLDIFGELGNDQSGYSVSLSNDGNIVAIGAIFNDGGGNASGHTRIFEWNGSAWIQKGLDIDGEASNDQSGLSVSLRGNGNIVAIGASYNDDGGSNSGHTRIYEWNGSVWIQKGSDIDGEAAGDRSGLTVSLSNDGNVVAIGAILNNGGGSNSGHTRIYSWNGSVWIQKGPDIDGDSAGIQSGYSVSLSADGSIVAIGAHLSDGNGNDSGNTRVYKINNSTGVHGEGSIFGVEAITSSTGTAITGSGGKVGINATGTTFGVQSITSGTGTAIIGSGGSIGVSTNGTTFGIYGHGGVTGIFAEGLNKGVDGSGNIGVYGFGSTYGLYGNSTSTAIHGSGGTIGVFSEGTAYGIDASGATAVHCNGSIVGVLADGATFGIEGTSTNTAVYGHGGAVGVLGDGYNYGVHGVSTTQFIQVGSDIDGEAGDDRSGYSVSLSENGNIVAVGAIFNNGGSGHVRIYEWNGTVWTQKGSDINGISSNDSLGYSVSLSSDGNIVAIGAPYNSDNGNNSGHVRIYEWNSVAWIQKGSDIGGETGDESGWHISLNGNGNIVAVGAPYNDNSGNDAGSVRLYEWITLTSSWTQKGSDINGGSTADQSGYSVSLSNDGNIVAIGAPYNDGSGNDSGHIRIYEWNVSAWIQKGSDIYGGTADDQFGQSVSLNNNGNIIAVGATNNSSGYVRIYEWITSAWIQKGLDIDGEAIGDQSGYSVSLSNDGNIVAIGATNNNGSGNNSGHVRVYGWNDSSWVQKGPDIDGERSDDQSGFSVSLSADGNIVAIGAPFNDDNGSNSGHVRVYKMSNATGVYGESTNIGVYGISTSAQANSYGIIGQGGEYAVYASGDMAYTNVLTNVSDQTIKKNITPLNSTIANVNLLNPVDFEFDTETYPNHGLKDGQKCGFIAQELALIFPNLVHNGSLACRSDTGNTGETGISCTTVKTVSQIELIPILTKSIQELHALIVTLQTQNTNLSIRVNALENPS